MTGRASRDKGNRAERAAISWLRAKGFDDARRSGAGFPGADVLGIDRVSVEIKNQARLDLAGWTDQLAADMTITGNPIGFVLVKRRQRANPDEWYAVTTGQVIARLLNEAGYS